MTNPTLTEHFYTGEFLLRELYGVSRDVVIFDNTGGAQDLLVQGGTVFAYESAALTAVATSGNTGNGSLSNLQQNLVAVQTGTYVVALTSATAFTVTAPDGTALQAGTVGTGYLDGIGFQLNAGGTAFVAGDGFNVTIANGAAPVVAAKTGGNTGNGTLTNVETAQVATAMPGNYLVTFTGATTFNVTDPKGNLLSPGTTGKYYEDRIGFLATSGGTAFVAGDSFTIGVGTGSGYATFWNGSNAVAGIIYNTDYVPAGGTLKMTAIMREAEVQLQALQFPAGTTPQEIQTAATQLRALHIIPR
jgi:hypothetical protein